ncbi:MAG: GNAT family N-acetyltransferase, partial [Hyphomicrobiales bacterium]
MRIETERLILAPHTRGDLEPLAAMWADPDTVRFIGGKPSTRQESWMRLLRYAGLWSILGYGYWAIHDKASGRFAGELGFADFGRDMTPSIAGIPEAGWVLAPWARSRGYASEALTTLRSAVTTDNGTTYPFNVPHFKIGTLDALVQQADELARLEGGCKGVVDKVGDSLRSLLEGDEDKIQEQKVVNDRECDIHERT